MGAFNRASRIISAFGVMNKDKLGFPQALSIATKGNPRNVNTLAFNNVEPLPALPPPLLAVAFWMVMLPSDIFRFSVKIAPAVVRLRLRVQG